jgi:predicted O-methyltransferase YrrM
MLVNPIRSIAYRLSRRAQLPREWYDGVRDVRRIRQAFPQLLGYHAMVERSRRELEPYYSEYVTTISIPVMAISLELAAFLDVMCMAHTPRRLLDLGSGFSSFVLRRYAGRDGAAVEVQSVDHAAEWLATTARYLERCGLGTSGLSTWSEFRSREHAPFDLILHDLGGPGDDHIGYRVAVLPEVLDLLAPGGVLVLDDAHIPALGPAARRLLHARGCRYWSLKRFVQDHLGRWALLAAK